MAERDIPIRNKRVDVLKKIMNVICWVTFNAENI